MHQLLFIFWPPHSTYHDIRRYSFYHPGSTEDALLLPHVNVWGIKHKAHSPITQTQIKNFTDISDAQQASIDNAIHGPIPEQILISLFKNMAFV